MRKDLTAEALRSVLNYDPVSGVFTWRAPVARSVSVGDVAGSRATQGYLQIKVSGRPYMAHRLAWLYVHGKWPADQVDHRNGDRTDNRIENLRECSQGENGQNLAVYRSNTSGLTGVTHRAGQWRARIDVGGKQKHLGWFRTAEDASAAYLRAKAELHPFQPVPRHA